MSYLIKRDDKKRDILYFNYNIEGYVFNPGDKSKKILAIKKIDIINPTLIDQVLTVKFNKLFNKLLHKIIIILDDEDTTDGDIEIILDEVEKFRSIIFHKYQQFLSEEKEKLFLEKIRILENELRSKQVILNDVYEEEHHKSRGR